MKELKSAEAFFSWLVTSGYLDGDSVARFQRVHREGNASIADILAELSTFNEVQIAERVAEFLNLPLKLHLDEVDPQKVETSIELSWQSENQVLLIREDGKVSIITADPFAHFAIRAVAYFFDNAVELVISTRKAVAAFLEQLSNCGQALSGGEDDDVYGDEEFQRLRELSNQAPNIKLVNDILHEAVTSGASDIHIEPAQNAVAVRVRLDGRLSLMRTIDKAKQQGFVTRLKVLANLNLAERRLPQDGRCRVTVRGDAVDFRVATMPSVFGETLVLRILSKQAQNLTLEGLGFSGSDVAAIDALIAAPNGLVLVAGPTGSGKTTTLYAMLSKLNRGTTKIFTIEDPIEYRLEGLTQTQIDAQIGLTFASALRSVLRHDPDVILVGEIRDKETAAIAIQASMTGHLVLATIHTNSAIAAVTRLRDMGVPTYLIAGSLRGVISQRLAKLAPFRGTASNRVACAEILHLNKDLTQLVSAGAGEQEITDKAKQFGFSALSEQLSSGVAAGVLDPSSLALIAGDA